MNDHRLDLIMFTILVRIAKYRKPYLEVCQIACEMVQLSDNYVRQTSYVMFERARNY